MIYKVARDGDEIGEFSVEALLEALERGDVRLDDDAWTEDLEDWVPVASLVEEDEYQDVETQASPSSLPSEPTRVIPPAPRAAQASSARLQPELDCSVPAQPVPLAPPSPVVQYVYVQPPVRHGQYGVPGVAIASLVCGILSFMLLLLTSVPAVICGHRALNKIKRAGGAYSGEWLAITGLVIGYVMSVVSMFVLLGFAMPVWHRMIDREHSPAGSSSATQR